MARQRESDYDRPLSDAEMKAPIRSTALFFRRAKAFHTLNNPGGTWPTIVLGPSPEWLEWREYFERHVGQVPVVMRKMIEGAPDAPHSFTVPAEFPVIFDQTFRQDPNWKPAPAKQPLSRAMRPVALQNVPRFDHARPAAAAHVEPAISARAHTSLTDADLRRLYGRKPDPLENPAAED